MGEELMIETTKENRNLQTRLNIIDSDEEKMKLNLQKLHV
jgi:hypothetical protein